MLADHPYNCMDVARPTNQNPVCKSKRIMCVLHSTALERKETQTRNTARWDFASFWWAMQFSFPEAVLDLHCEPSISQ